ncbi:MAG: hypothetical protein R2876_07070 [Eubacteriales bacterium]
MYIKNYAEVKKNRVKKKKKRLIFFISLAVLAAVLLIIGITIFKSSNPKDLLKTMPFQTATSSIYNKKGIMYASDDALICINSSGKQLWSSQLFASGVSLFASDNYVVAFKEQTIQVFKSNGDSMFTKNIGQNIVKVICGKNSIGVFYSVTSDSETEQTQNYLLVLNLSGDEIETIDFEDQNILKYDFYSDDDELWTLSLDTSGVTPVSEVVTYKPGKAVTGNIQFTENIVEDVYFNDSYMYVLTTNYLSTYDLYGSIQNTILIYGWHSDCISVIDGSPRFMCLKRSEDEHTMMRIITPGVSDTQINLPGGIKNITVYKNKIYLIGLNKIYKYDISGTQEKAITLPYTYESIRITGQDYVLFSKGDKVYSYPLS